MDEIVKLWPKAKGIFFTSNLKHGIKILIGISIRKVIYDKQFSIQFYMHAACLLNFSFSIFVVAAAASFKNVNVGKKLNLLFDVVVGFFFQFSQSLPIHLY